MTNINCSKNCIYQKDGKCSYDNVLLPTGQASDTKDGCLYQLSAAQAEKLNIKPLQ